MRPFMHVAATVRLGSELPFVAITIKDCFGLGAAVGSDMTNGNIVRRADLGAQRCECPVTVSSCVEVPLGAQWLDQCLMLRLHVDQAHRTIVRSSFIPKLN